MPHGEVLAAGAAASAPLAAGEAAGAGHGGESLTQIILHHVANGPAIVPLHLGPLDLSISKHVVLLAFAALCTLVLFLWYAAHLRRAGDGVPSGQVAHIVDFWVQYIHDKMVAPLVGAEHAAAWTPLIAAFFFFILINNLIGLTPLFEWVPGGGSGTATGNFNVTAGLAVVTFCAIIWAGTAVHGFVGHWRNMVPHGVAPAVLPILIPIELLGMFVRPFALTMRLAANMTAGHIAILAILSLIFLFKSALIGVLAIPLVIGLMLLEIIVCFVQAYVFTLLSTVFIGMAVKAHH